MAYVSNSDGVFRPAHSTPCKMKHTPIAPVKDDVRSEWMWKANRTEALVTISPFALGVANTLRWSGPCWVVDKEEPVIKAAKRMKEQFPRLDIRGAHLMLVEDFMPVFFARENLKRVVTDLDLTGSIKTLYSTLKSVYDAYLQEKAHGMIYLTFSERGDGLCSTTQRRHWLEERLPKEVKLVSSRSYLSDRWDENARLKPGANMCIFGLKL